MRTEAVVSLEGVTKTFPGVVALNKVDFSVRYNEILGLVGENGAGKSTLMKILIGLYKPDAGEMRIRGELTTLKDPESAGRNGIGMVFQEGCMIPNLTVCENLFLSHEDGFMRHGLLQHKLIRQTARQVLARVGVAFDPDTVVQTLTPGEQQMVEIARLLWLSTLYEIENPVLILDEPTTVLLDDETRRLFQILQEIKQNASVIFISHRLEEIVENSDRIVVFKDGEYVTELDPGQAKISEIEKLMVGKELTLDHFWVTEQGEPEADQAEVLGVNELYLEGKFEPISFSIGRGEIVSLVGLVGSGKEEICECLTGTVKATSGRVTVEGQELRLTSPGDAVDNGIGHIPKERRSAGLALDMSVMDNINLLVLRALKKRGFISRRLERANALKWVTEARIKTPSIHTKSAHLSGGNQQKTIISKWLSSSVQVLILDHPTRGVDVGAKSEIYGRIRKLARSGMSLLIMCDTLEEDIGLCDRMIILKDGRVVRQVQCPPGQKPTPLDLIDAIV